MKTIDELYNEVVASEELKKEFLSLKADGIEEFVKAHGCEATLDELKEFFAAKNKSGELADTDLSQVSGGKGANVDEAVVSIVTVGIYCALFAIESTVTGHCGTAIERDDCMLCDALK